MTDKLDNVIVQEDRSKLFTIDCYQGRVDCECIVQHLRQDMVLLLRNLNSDQADIVMHDVAARLGLRESLELQVGFANFLGHRHNIGKYFMSVNKRGAYQFVTPHSEGSHFIGMQLASFFCYENSTD